MVQNVADEIRTKEAAARELVLDARKEAAKIAASARTAAEQSVKEARQKSHRFFRERVRAAEVEAEESAVKKVEEGRRAAEAFYDGKKGQVIPVSDWLVKEVMSAYGDN